MLNINFMSENLSATTEESIKARLELATAVKFEELDMLLTLDKDLIKALDKKIDNKAGKYTIQQVEGFKSEKKQIEEDIATTEKTVEEVRPVYELVLARMTEVPECSEYGNKLENVRNILRVIASAENTKLEKYALVETIGNKELYNALETCHSFSNITDNGNRTQSKALKDAYAKAESEVKSILKNALSLPFATYYTDSLRVKFNGVSLAKIHECYVTGISNKYEKDKESGDINFKGHKVNTLISAKTSKDGKTTYNFAKLATLIARLTVEYIAK